MDLRRFRSRIARENNSPGGTGTPSYQSLGYFVCTSGTLVIQVSNAAAAGVEADSAKIQQIQGNGGGDDDFHLTSGSPAIDAGKPASLVGQEPQPNGGRINLGSDGGTPQATTSAAETVSVLTPGPLDKLQIGQQVNVTWQTGNLYAPADYYSGTILADSPLAYYRLGDASGTTAVDASSNELNASYVGGVTLGQPGAFPFDPDSAVTLDGSSGYVQLPKLSSDFTSGFSAEIWADPTSVGSSQRFFDLGNGSSADNIVLYRVGTTNNLGFVVFSGSSEGTQVIANNAITLNQWQYFAVTLDSHGHVTLYKNGVAIATGTTDVPCTGIVRSNNYLGKSNFGDACYAGGFDEAAFYAQPLSADQIAAPYARSVFGTVNIDLLQNGVFVQNIATDLPDTLSYLWTVPAYLTQEAGYQVRVTVNDADQPSGASTQSFLITNNGTSYYINDGSTAGDVFTTATGNDNNSGKDPADPMATLGALVQAYGLTADDTVYIDTGNYLLLHNTVLNAGDNGDLHRPLERPRRRAQSRRPQHRRQRFRPARQHRRHLRESDHHRRRQRHRRARAAPAAPGSP